MLNQKNNKGQKNIGDKSKNKLPPIGTPNQVNKKKNNTNNKIYENNKSLVQENNDNMKRHANTKTKIGQIKNPKNIPDEKNSNKNNKLLKSRNNDDVNRLNNINKTLNKHTDSIIVDETGKIDKNISKIIQKIYKIIFVFRNEDFYISVKAETTIKNLRLSISKLINLDIKQIAMIYEDKEIDISNDDKTVNAYFNFKKLRSRPIIYIKKKFVSNNLSEDGSSNYYLFKKNFNNKVKIVNFPSISDLTITIDENINNVINNFFKNNSSFGEVITENNQYKIEIGNENTEENDENKGNNIYIIGFPSPDLAFDFNRYLNTLKLINPVYKDIKSNIISMKKRGSENKINNNSNKNSPKGNLRYGIDYNLEENNLTKRNSQILKLIRNNFLQRKQLKKEKNNSQIYINASGPYLSPTDKDRIEEKENKKKWINPEGFISCVGKYSGIQL